MASTFIGLAALTSETLALPGRGGVAASILVAAALLKARIRVQRLVDRRFKRARHDPDATVGAFTARLRDAVELDTVRTDLLDAVSRAVQPRQRLAVDQAVVDSASLRVRCAAVRVPGHGPRC